MADLRQQVLDKWGANGDWNAGGVDRAAEAASWLGSQGVTDLSQLQITPGQARTGPNFDYATGESGQALPTDSWTPYSMSFNGQQLGTPAPDPSLGWTSRPDRNRVGWSGEGHGNVSYYLGENGVTPMWDSSSDMGEGPLGQALTAGALMGGMYLGGTALQGSLAGAGAEAGATTGATTGGTTGGTTAGTVGGTTGGAAAGAGGTGGGSILNTAGNVARGVGAANSIMNAAGSGGGNMATSGGNAAGNVATLVGSQVAGAALAPNIPDYNAAADKQGVVNTNAALQSNQMNRVDTTTPYGSQTFSRVADPNVPGGFRYQMNTSLSPEQQWLLAAQVRGQTARANFGNDVLLPQMRDTYSHQWDPNSYGRLQNAPTAFQGSMMGQPTALGRLGNGPEFQQINTPDQIDYERVGSGNALGQYQTADTGKFTPYSFGAEGPEVRDLYGKQGYAPQVDAVRQSVLDQFHNANDQNFARQTADLDNKLKNMGLTEGTEAYDREMQNLRQSQNTAANDAAQRAMQMAGQEQTRLANLDMSANEQTFQQQQTANFLNSLASATFNAGENQRGYGNLLNAIAVNNAARTGSSADELNRTGFNNNATHTGTTDYFNQGVTATGANNATRQQRFTNQGTTAGFNNNAAQQDMQNQFIVGAYNNARGQQNWQNSMDETTFNNNIRNTNALQGLTARGLPIAEYNTITANTGPTTPQFQPYGMSSINPGNYQTAAAQQGAGNLQAANYRTGVVQQGINQLPGVINWINNAVNAGGNATRAGSNLGNIPFSLGDNSGYSLAGGSGYTLGYPDLLVDPFADPNAMNYSDLFNFV